MSVNILDQNGNLKKIAHGFPESKFNIFRSDVISNIEMTDTASKDYAVGDFLIMANGQLAQVTSTIYQDMTINLSNVRLTTVEEMIAAKADPADIPDVSKYQKIFTGTMAEWNQLTTDQKTAYDLANIIDDLGTEADIVDAVTDGDMRAVTSNAVHDALESKISTSETTGLVKNDGSIDTKSYAEKVANGTENNLAGLDANGNLKDGGWSSDKTTTSATGNPISISGLKSNQLAINPIITFEPIQAGSGTPSPSNVMAISGYDKVEVLSCGKNLIIDSVPNASVNLSGVVVTVSAAEHVSIAPVVKGQSYTFNKLDGATIAYGFFVNRPKLESSSYNNSRTTASSGDSVVVVAPITGYIAINNADSLTNEQVELGSSPTTYEPPVKTTDLSESLGQTVYGGTLDVRSGKFTVTHKIVDMGSLGWYKSSVFFTAEILDKVDGSAQIWCSCFDYSANKGYTTPSDGVSDSNSSGYTKVVFVHPSATYADATAFQTAMIGQKLVYKLATPVEIQLTPHEISLLKDYAYVRTNGTSIQFDYHNGELASLADVSQLGETVNELGNKVSELNSDVSQLGIDVNKCMILVAKKSVSNTTTLTLSHGLKSCSNKPMLLFTGKRAWQQFYDCPEIYYLGYVDGGNSLLYEKTYRIISPAGQVVASIVGNADYSTGVFTWTVTFTGTNDFVAYLYMMNG